MKYEEHPYFKEHMYRCHYIQKDLQTTLNTFKNRQTLGNSNLNERDNYDTIYNNYFKLDYKVKESLVIEKYLQDLMNLN